MSTTPRWLHVITKTLSDNAPTILSGIAVAGVVGTAVLAVKATPKAMSAISQKQIEKQTQNEIEDEDRDLTIKEKALAIWRPYLPATISGTATIACIVGANAIGLKQQAALLGAYTLVDGAFREYKDKVHEIIGAQKSQKVDDEIAKDRFKENPPAPSQVIITGLGEQTCCDLLTGRYFKSDIEAIRKAQNEVNAQVLTDMYASQNEFYTLVGLAPTVIGEELGWNIETRMDIVFTSILAEDGTPCLAVGYAKLPIYNYDRI